VKENLINLFTDIPADKADLIILILTSQNIENIAEKKVGDYKTSFNILVKEIDADKANKAVKAYYKENKYFRLKQKLESFPISSFKSYPAFLIMALLWFIHSFFIYYNIHEDMILKYGASALFILQGQTYRAVTALFLHADARHLVGNMAGMLIFGAPFISLAGFGAGPLMLLAAGTLGNLINAYLYQTAHLSIGASTSVMAAAGLLVAHQVTQKNKPFSLNTLMPIFAGTLLVGMFSQGERTDVWAHIFGFFCGLFSGIIFLPFNRIIQSIKKDIIASIITILILMTAFLRASI
jgi:rhomboid protease GluP